MKIDVLKVGLPARDGYTVAAILWSVDRRFWNLCSYKENGRYSASDQIDHNLDIVDEWTKLKVIK